ncbi:hypothetical protein [Roseibium litorale]|uniref:Uncharacterized protein n=1 Tax=Roseibium litorale TaxID=2803841 RepID=A0ABR9CTQ1_9HYPH|nr:hypothetical protein [Roseibium litorale]MBD8894123.1 hypothetical protein [Roseibium litorale]
MKNRPQVDNVQPAFASAVGIRRSKAKRPSPVSIRFSNSERAELEERANGQALGPYIKDYVLRGHEAETSGANGKRRSDVEIVARTLRELGRSELHSSLRRIYELAAKGNLAVDDEVVETIEEACAAAIAMRRDLVAFLGPREGKGE